MSHNQINFTAYHVMKLNYQKAPKAKITCSYLKGVISIKGTGKLLLSVTKMEKSSKSGERLHNEKFSLMAESSHRFQLFLQWRNFQVFTHPDFKITFCFVIIGSTVTISLNFAFLTET